MSESIPTLFQTPSVSSPPADDQLASILSDIFDDNEFNDGVSCEIGGNRKIELTTYKGADCMDIYEVGTDEIGVWGRKGITLGLESWACLNAWMLKITEILLESTTKSDVAFNLHLGENKYVTVTSGVFCVDIRQWYVNRQNVTRPGRTGIGLRISEWEKMVELIPTINTRLTKLRSARAVCITNHQC